MSRWGSWCGAPSPAACCPANADATAAARIGARRASFDFPLVDKERAFDCIDAMRRIADEKGATVACVALAWLLTKPHVSAIIVGAKNEEQLRDNLKASDFALEPHEIAELDKVSALPPEYPGWMIEFLRNQGRAPKNAR